MPSKLIKKSSLAINYFFSIWNKVRYSILIDLPDRAWKFEIWLAQREFQVALGNRACVKFHHWSIYIYDHNNKLHWYVLFIVQKRNIRKSIAHNHYCNTFFKYAKELAIRYSDHCSFISTDNKWKIKVGESNFSIAVVAHGKRVDAVLNQLFEVTDHKFSSVTITPTVELSVFSIQKPLWVLQKARIRQYLHLPIFSFTCAFLFCRKISCFGCCFSQQITPQNTVQLFMLRDYSTERIRFYMINKCHALPVVHIMLV